MGGRPSTEDTVLAPSSAPCSLAGLDSIPAPARRRLARCLEARRPAIVRRWLQSQFDEELIKRYNIAGLEHVERAAIEQQFLNPLWELLAVFLRTGEPRYRDVYLDERLRYAPHRADPSVRASFFAEVIPLDEAAILNEVSLSPSDCTLLEGFLRQLHAPLLDTAPKDSIHLLSLGDCLMGELRVFLPSRCREEGINLDIRVLYFSAAMARELSSSEVLNYIETNPPDVIALSFLTYEALPPYPALLQEAHKLSPSEMSGRVTAITGLMRRFMMKIREKTEAPFLLHNASGLPIRRLRRLLPFLPAISRPRRKILQALNDSIRELAENAPNTILIDEVSLAARHGHRDCAGEVIPHRIAHHAFFHTARFGEYLAEPYLDVLKSYRDLRKAKVLMVDFDNTLWEGVMADGPVRQYRERQKLLRDLKDSGILLVGLSKNDPKNVRWDEMILREEDLVLSKISWNPKVESIQETAQQLDLGLNSLVFIDDSAEERELVRTQLPMVCTLDSGDPYTWRSLERMLAFPNTRQTEESRNRTELYRAQAQRREVMSSSYDYEAALNSLQLKVFFGEASPRDLERISELILRTNQFNTTTVRYNRAQLGELLKSPRHRIYVAELSDKLGSLGLVAVAIIEHRNGTAVFDSFVMSCRAMGFELERLMLRLVLDAEDAVQCFVGRFLPTDRNTPASNLYPNSGFTKRSDTEWVLDAKASRPQSPSWFTVLSRGSRNQAKI